MLLATYERVTDWHAGEFVVENSLDGVQQHLYALQRRTQTCSGQRWYTPLSTTLC
jgi:hypothetical protein